MSNNYQKDVANNTLFSKLKEKNYKIIWLTKSID